MATLSVRHDRIYSGPACWKLARSGPEFGAVIGRTTHVKQQPATQTEHTNALVRVAIQNCAWDFVVRVVRVAWSFQL